MYSGVPQNASECKTRSNQRGGYALFVFSDSDMFSLQRPKDDQPPVTVKRLVKHTEITKCDMAGVIKKDILRLEITR